MSEVKFSPDQFVSSTKLVRNLAEYIDKAKETPLLIVRDYKPEVVMLNVKEYERLLSVQKMAMQEFSCGERSERWECRSEQSGGV